MTRSGDECVTIGGECPVRRIVPDASSPCEPHSQDWDAMSAAGSLAALTQIGRCLQYRKNHDDLTGLLTYPAMRQRLEERFGSSSPYDERRRRIPCLVGFIDGDRFGELNHTMGQDGGDFAIRALANRVRGFIRPYDLIGADAEDASARRGGDEIVIAIPGMTLIAAYTRMRYIRAQLDTRTATQFEGQHFEWRADVVGLYLEDPRSADDVTNGLQVASQVLGAWKEGDRQAPPPLLLQASGEPYDLS